MNRNKLYVFIIIACVVGYSWIGINLRYDTKSVGVCIIRAITGIPCPSCGSTRSVLAMVHGHVFDAVLINPFGIILSFLLLIVPFWIAIDLINRRNSFYVWYKKAEQIIKQKKVAIPLICLVLCNWAWNIYKDI